MRGFAFLIILLITISAFSQQIGYQEKVYVHINKPYFVIGETLYYTVYVLNATTGEPETPSRIAQIRVLDDEKNLIANQAVRLQNGVGSGAIELSDTLSGQVYSLLAYTNYQKNFGDEHVFVQPFPVYNLNGFRNGSNIQVSRKLQLKHHFDGNWLHLYATRGDAPISAQMEFEGKTHQTDDNGYLKIPVTQAKQLKVVVSSKEEYLEKNIKLQAPMISIIEQDRFYQVAIDALDESTLLQLKTKGVVVYEKALAASSQPIRIPFDRSGFPPGYNNFQLIGTSGKIIAQASVIHTPMISAQLQYDTTQLKRRNSLKIQGVLNTSQAATVSISVYADPLQSLTKPISLSAFLTVSSELTQQSRNLSEKGMANIIQPRDYAADGLGIYGFEKEELVIDGLTKPSKEALFIAAFDEVPLFDFLKTNVENLRLVLPGVRIFLMRMYFSQP